MLQFVDIPGAKLPCFGLNADQLLFVISHALKELEHDLANLECSCETVSVQTVLLPLERIVDREYISFGILTHLLSVADSKEIRSAAKAIQHERVRFRLKVAQSKRLFEKLQSLSRSQELNEAQKRAVEAQIRRATLDGIALSDEKRNLFNANEEELTMLCRKFKENIHDATKQFGKLVTDKELLQGLPTTCLALAAKAARSKGYELATPELGPWLITIDKTTFLQVIGHLNNRELREELYRAYRNKASSGEFNNSLVLSHILALRDSQAKLLGYNNYAEVAMVTRMATLGTAEDLLETLRSGSWDGGLQELEELKFLAKSHDIMPWDVLYWTQRLLETKLELNEEELRPFLAFPRVLEGLFKLAKDLFDIEIEAADYLATKTLWHKDVRFFRVKDVQSGATVAYFYLDPYSRPDKKAGAWVTTFLQRSRGLAPDDYPARLPVCIVVCNQTPPLGGEPSLMTFKEMKTLFHEFGHALQQMLTTQEMVFVAGMRNVERDASELPSQFMENWCYNRKTLATIMVHYKSGEPLPEPLLAKINDFRNVRAIHMLDQILLATVDLELHSRFQGGIEIHEVFERLSRKIQIPNAVMPGDRYLCSFVHISVGPEYAAGYYGYKWAEVLSADAFSAFEEAGHEDSKALKETGMRFRDTVLALGGGMAALDVFKAFRGRGPSVDPLLKHYGLCTK